MLIIQFLRSVFVTACPSLSHQHPNPERRLLFLHSSCTGIFMAGELQDGTAAALTQSEFLLVNDCLRLGILIFSQICDTINYQDCSGRFCEALRTSSRTIP
nr:MAG TPA: hypothetical protein [Caudoviricetes sp.]